MTTEKRKSIQSSSNKSLFGPATPSQAAGHDHHPDDTHELFDHKSSKKASGFIVNGGEKRDLGKRHSFVMPDLSPSMAAIRDRGKTSIVKAKKKIDPRPNRHKLAPLESYQRQIEYRAEASGRVLIRLERIMGDDRIRVTDRKYLNTFFKGLLADEQKVWRKRSMQRKKAERERFRQLAIAGEMEPSPEMADLYDNPVYRANQALNRLMKMDASPYQENLPPITPVEPFEVYDRTGYLFPEHPGHYKLGGKALYPSPKASTTMSTRGEEEEETMERMIHPLKATQTSSMTLADPRTQFSPKTVAETDTFLKKYVRESGMIVNEEDEEKEMEIGNEGETEDGDEGEIEDGDEGEREDGDEGEREDGDEGEREGGDKGESDEEGEENYADEEEEGEEYEPEAARKVISPYRRTDETFLLGTCDPDCVGKVTFSEAQRRMGIDVEEQIEKTFAPHRSELVGKFVEDEASNADELFSSAKDITETYKREMLHTVEQVDHMVKVGGPGYFEIHAPPPPPPPPKEKEERRTSQTTEQAQPLEERRTFDFSRIEQPDKSPSQTSATDQPSVERKGSQESKKSDERRGSQESKKSNERKGSQESKKSEEGSSFQDSVFGQKSEERRSSEESTMSRQKSQEKRTSQSDEAEEEQDEKDDEPEDEEQEPPEEEEEQEPLEEEEDQELPEEDEQESSEQKTQDQEEDDEQEQEE